MAKKDIFSFLNPPKPKHRINIVKKEVWKTNPAMAIIPVMIGFFGYIGIAYLMKWPLSKFMAGAAGAVLGLIYLAYATIEQRQVKHKVKRRR